jgi:hypothetical protein
MQPVALPVEIVERQQRDFPSAQSIGDHQQKHGIVAPTTDSASVDLIEHLLDRIPTDRSRDIGQSIMLRHLDELADVALEEAVPVQILKKNTERAGNVHDRPGAEMLGRRRYISCDYGQR